jgi:hypothetical protein
MRLETRTLYSLLLTHNGQARRGRARWSGAGIVGPRERRRKGVRGGEAPRIWLEGRAPKPRSRRQERVTRLKAFGLQRLQGTPQAWTRGARIRNHRHLARAASRRTRSTPWNATERTAFSVPPARIHGRRPHHGQHPIQPNRKSASGACSGPSSSGAVRKVNLAKVRRLGSVSSRQFAAQRHQQGRSGGMSRSMPPAQVGWCSSRRMRDEEVVATYRKHGAVRFTHESPWACTLPPRMAAACVPAVPGKWSIGAPGKRSRGNV